MVFKQGSYKEVNGSSEGICQKLCCMVQLQTKVCIPEWQPGEMLTWSDSCTEQYSIQIPYCWMQFSPLMGSCSWSGMNSALEVMSFFSNYRGNVEKESSPDASLLGSWSYTGHCWESWGLLIFCRSYHVFNICSLTYQGFFSTIMQSQRWVLNNDAWKCVAFCML